MVKRIRINENIDDFAESVSCIGFFDGVHRGHLKLINKTIEDAKKYNCKPRLICFDPEPSEIIDNKHSYHILSYKDRINKIKEYGIADIVVFEFNQEMMNLSAQDFINLYLNRMNIKELVCGFDFHFGYKAKGDEKLLKSLGNFEVEVIEQQNYYGLKISSSRIRNELVKGNFELAKKLLNYPYTIDIRIENCLKQGSKWLVEASITDKWNIINKTKYKNNSIQIENGKILLLDDITYTKGIKKKLRLDNEPIIF